MLFDKSVHPPKTKKIGLDSFPIGLDSLSISLVKVVPNVVFSEHFLLPHTEMQPKSKTCGGFSLKTFCTFFLCSLFYEDTFGQKKEQLKFGDQCKHHLFSLFDLPEVKRPTGACNKQRSLCLFLQNFPKQCIVPSLAQNLRLTESLLFHATSDHGWPTMVHHGSFALLKGILGGGSSPGRRLKADFVIQAFA